jgi:serine/threonine-protein kinase
MSEGTAEKFGQRILDARLLDHSQLDAAWADIGSRDATLEEFIGVLLRKQMLTNLQVDKLQKKERFGFFYGKYKVLYVVGTGSFARVYRAEHGETGQVVAVKVLRNRYVQDAKVVAQFLDEARMVQQLRHVNIVPVFEVDSERERPYMVMEFVEGQNLREFLKVRKKLEVEEALGLIEDIANGLDYAASKKVKHRDLKASNVLVTSAKRGKLVDFGLAAVEAATADVKQTSQRSIDYAGLERLTGVRKDDPRSDIYFAGAIFYLLLTGQTPLTETRDRSQRLNASRFREVKPVTEIAPELPAGVVYLVNKAMDLNAEKRFQTPGELLSEVRSVRRAIELGEEHAPGEGDGGNGGKIDREGEDRAVMIVESNIEMQDTLRDLLKRRGYRVLVIGNAERALNRFTEDETPADCVLFCTTEMARDAIDAFNQFGDAEHTKSIPSVLLLDGRHQDLAGIAQVGPHRVLLAMPLKVRQLRAILLKLLSDAAAQRGKDE